MVKICRKKMHWFSRTLNQYPVIRGMISYGVVWPCSSITQQCLQEGISPLEANWWTAARYSTFGAFAMSPVLYNWMKFTDRFYKEKTLKSVIKRCVIERLTYSPFAVCFFFFGMCFMETRDVDKSINEVKTKFWPTWTAAIVFWTLVQMGNYYAVPSHYRVVYSSICGYIFAIYLAFIKSMTQEQLKSLISRGKNKDKTTENGEDKTDDA